VKNINVFTDGHDLLRIPSELAEACSRCRSASPIIAIIRSAVGGTLTAKLLTVSTRPKDEFDFRAKFKRSPRTS
jgi:hypothetical protein